MIKRTFRPTRKYVTSRGNRGGVTLVEVLMSLLVVGIGVVSVAVLFPLSILRTIEATQLTAATALRYNVEELIDAFPALIFDPDGDGNAVEHQNAAYIVDPVGDVLVRTLPGDPPNMPSGPAVAFAGFLERFRGALDDSGAMAPLLATTLGSSTDTWDTLLESEATLTGFDNTVGGGPPPTPAIVIPDAFAATGESAAYDSTVPGVNIYRVILFDESGRFSHTRLVTAIQPDDTVSWGDPLPAGFVPATAWLQVQQQQYSWLLTVRRQFSSEIAPGPPQVTDEIAEIDVVVFFNRSVGTDEPLSAAVDDMPAALDPLAESAYPLVEPGFQVGVSEVTVDWDGEPEPFLKKGGFVFDPENARWYRILEIIAVTPTRARLQLDRGADASSSADSNGNGFTGAGVFLRGIVDVYPITNKTARYINTP